MTGGEEETRKTRRVELGWQCESGGKVRKVAGKLEKWRDALARRWILTWRENPTLHASTTATPQSFASPNCFRRLQTAYLGIAPSRLSILHLRPACRQQRPADSTALVVSFAALPQRFLSTSAAAPAPSRSSPLSAHLRIAVQYCNHNV